MLINPECFLVNAVIQSHSWSPEAYITARQIYILLYPCPQNVSWGCSITVSKSINIMHVCVLYIVLHLNATCRLKWDVKVSLPCCSFQHTRFVRYSSQSFSDFHCRFQLYLHHVIFCSSDNSSDDSLVVYQIWQMFLQKHVKHVRDVSTSARQACGTSFCHSTSSLWWMFLGSMSRMWQMVRL